MKRKYCNMHHEHSIPFASKSLISNWPIPDVFVSNSILIKFNVNHTVDADETPAYENEERSEQSQENTNVDQLKSKPNFEVDIVRNGTTLSFTCSFLPGEPAEGDFGKWFLHFPIDNFERKM